MTIVGNQIAVNLDSILFATDFFPRAEAARLYVQAQAARYPSQVRMMHSELRSLLSISLRKPPAERIGWGSSLCFL